MNTRVLSFVLVGSLFLLGTGCANPSSAASRTPNDLGQRVDNAIHQDNSVRPKTIGEWNQDARETKNAPGKRLKKIAEQSKEAVKELGEVYPNTAEKSARTFDENKALVNE
ncbi:hypothetical protein [Altericista sp. CCNU0014]|uniref:hypothetical protein n=1 Tax=Altericista sp. CCNU0014 TaxID=3082949 RepID=UPI00384D3D3F